MSVFDPDDKGIQPGPEALGLPTSEREYLIPAKDSQGRSIRVMCRVSPEISRLIGEVHQSRKWPFRVQGDLIRFAIHTVVKKLAVAAGLEGSVIAHGEMLHQMLVDEEYQLQWEENFRLMRRIVDKYMARGAPGKAREIITRCLVSVRMQMQEGYWRSQYEAEILKRYGAILDGEEGTDARKPTSASTAQRSFVPQGDGDE